MRMRQAESRPRECHDNVAHDNFYAFLEDTEKKIATALRQMRYGDCTEAAQTVALICEEYAEVRPCMRQDRRERRKKSRQVAR